MVNLSQEEEMPKGCSRHLSTRRRAVSGADLHSYHGPYVCIPPRPPRREGGDLFLSLSRLGQAILNRIHLRRLIKGVKLLNIFLCSRTIFMFVREVMCVTRTRNCQKLISVSYETRHLSILSILYQEDRCLGCAR